MTPEDANPGDESGTRVVLALPEYDRAWDEFVYRALNEVMADAHPVLRQIKPSSTSPIGPVQYADMGEPLTQEPISICACFRLDSGAFLRTDIESIITAIAEAAYEALGPFMAAFYERFSEICTNAGTTADLGGKAISWDAILDCLDRMEFSFDDNDRPGIPSCIASPDSVEALHRQPFTQAHWKRFRSILQAKREAHDARKRHRRLS